MIFKPELVTLILAGNKTQTRRPVLYGLNGKVIPCRYKVGHTYAVQPGRGKRQVARIEILEVRRESWGAISEPDAIAEGFTAGWAYDVHRPAYWHFWEYVRQLYPTLEPTDECWVLRFRRVGSVQ